MGAKKLKIEAAILCATVFIGAGKVYCQETEPTAPPPAQASAPSTPGGVSAQQLSNANNPLADMNALNFENFYSPTLYGVPQANANTMNLRPVVVSGRQIIRATLPFSTVPVSGGQYKSGLGDLNIFDAIKLTSEGSKTDFAIGPLLVVPTGTNRALGSGKWQAGAAGVIMHPMPGGSLLGALVTWQHSFAGQDDRPPAQVATLQPLGAFSIGGGYYVRSTAVWVFDFENNSYLIPLGLGFGKAFKVGRAVVNAFAEPQFTVYHKGDGLPSIQIFMGLKFQFPKKSKK